MRLEECPLSDMYKIWLDMGIGLEVLQMKLPSCCEYEKNNLDGIHVAREWSQSLHFSQMDKFNLLLTMKTRVISVLMVKIYTFGKLKKTIHKYLNNWLSQRSSVSFKTI